MRFQVSYCRRRCAEPVQLSSLESVCVRLVHTGAFWFLLGCTAVIWWFPQPVALCAIVCLSFGDPAASLAGAIFHRRSPRIPLTRDKTVAGALGAIVASSASVAVFLGVYPHMGHASLGVVEYVRARAAAQAVRRCKPLTPCPSTCAAFRCVSSSPAV